MEGREIRMGIEQARARLADLARVVAGGGPPVVLTRRGRPLAVLVSLKDFARISGSPSEGADS